MKRFSNLPRLALLGLAAVLLMSCGLCMGIVLMSPDAEPDEQAAATAATAVVEQVARAGDEPAAAPDDATAAPTEAPPTAAPTDPPTRTPRPTATPHSTATPRPTATPNATAAAREAATAVAAAQSELLAEMAYSEAIIQIGNDYQAALNGLATQSQAVADNPYLIVNDDWKVDTVIYLAAMRIAGDEVRALDPPQRFEAVHADLLEAADHFDLVAQYYAEGVDELDSNKLELALTNMQLGSAAIQRATAKLEGMTND